MNINANNIITEFSQANMNAIIQAYPLGDLRYREHFPLLYNPLLTYSNIEGADGAKIMADIVAIGSKAPRKGREFVENIKGEIPKLEIARDLNEKDLLTIQQLRYAVNANPTNAGIKNQLFVLTVSMLVWSGWLNNLYLLVNTKLPLPIMTEW